MHVFEMSISTTVTYNLRIAALFLYVVSLFTFFLKLNVMSISLVSFLLIYIFSFAVEKPTKVPYFEPDLGTT